MTGSPAPDPATPAEAPLPGSIEINGYHIAIWSRDNLADAAMVEQLIAFYVRYGYRSMSPASLEHALARGLVLLTAHPSPSNHTILGMAAVSGLPTVTSAMYFMTDLIVERHHRRHGVGHALTAAVEVVAAARDMQVLWLLVSQDNHTAQRLYMRHGFHVQPHMLMAKDVIVAPPDTR